MDALTQAGVVHDQLLAAIALAVSEAFGNAVLHAYPDAVGDVDVRVDYGTNEIIVTVADSGVGITRPAPEPGLGLGLQLIAALTLTRMIDSDTTGTTVTMRFNSDPEPPSPEHTSDVDGDPETPVAGLTTHLRDG